MPSSDSDVADAATRFHEDIPHRFQVSLTMSMETRDRLRTVRDRINEACGEKVFTLDDVVHLALEATAAYEGADDSTTDLDADAAERLRPLTAVIGAVLDADGEGVDGAEK
jgi:hypothetical protein